MLVVPRAALMLTGMQLRNRLDKAKDGQKTLESQVAELGAALDREKELRPESVCRLIRPRWNHSTILPQATRTSALQEIAETRKQISELDKELEAYGACNPIKVEEKKRAVMLAHEAAVRWTGQ